MHTPFNCKGEICYFVFILYTIWWTAFYYLTCVFQFKSHWRTFSANPVVMRVTICISFIQRNTVCFYNLCLCILHWLKNNLLLSFFCQCIVYLVKKMMCCYHLSALIINWDYSSCILLNHEKNLCKHHHVVVSLVYIFASYVQNLVTISLPLLTSSVANFCLSIKRDSYCFKHI